MRILRQKIYSRALQEKMFVRAWMGEYGYSPESYAKASLTPEQWAERYNAGFPINRELTPEERKIRNQWIKDGEKARGSLARESKKVAESNLKEAEELIKKSKDSNVPFRERVYARNKAASLNPDLAKSGDHLSKAKRFVGQYTSPEDLYKSREAYARKIANKKSVSSIAKLIAR